MSPYSPSVALLSYQRAPRARPPTSSRSCPTCRCCHCCRHSPHWLRYPHPPPPPPQLQRAPPLGCMRCRRTTWATAATRCSCPWSSRLRFPRLSSSSRDRAPLRPLRSGARRGGRPQPQVAASSARVPRRSRSRSKAAACQFRTCRRARGSLGSEEVVEEEEERRRAVAVAASALSTLRCCRRSTARCAISCCEASRYCHVCVCACVIVWKCLTMLSCVGFFSAPVACACFPVSCGGFLSELCIVFRRLPRFCMQMLAC